MKLPIEKQNGNGKKVSQNTRGAEARGKRHWLSEMRGSLGELGEGALQLLNGILPYVPHLQVEESDAELVVRASLPGVDQGSLEVALEDASLVIRGTKTTERETRRRNYRRVTKLHRTFERSLPLHCEVERTGTVTIRADVLTVRLPKADASPSRSERVPVAADASKEQASHEPSMQQRVPA